MDKCTNKYINISVIWLQLIVLEIKMQWDDYKMELRVK